ncbi:PTH2-domain-containing protein [Mycena pura]|uniref:peptidyl-tRNA hydrolase n=1 Tax=Mycena pura TaxID=153505 RepID=A0AAD6YPU2_9AGAR|nr:PTH2-domain-containing protein [Mycena pura]
MIPLFVAYIVVVPGSLLLGYCVGAAAKPSKVPYKHSATVEGDSDSESEGGDVAALTTLGECKLVLAVRTDLGMTTGKIAAQHATLACYKSLLSKNPALLRRWARTGYLKAVVRCSGEDELLVLQAQAQSLSLCTRSIQDAGRTQIAAGSTTVLGIAGPCALVEQVTEELIAWDE